MSYNSKNDTFKHIKTVQRYLKRVCAYLTQLAELHDSSKLRNPEKEIFDIFTPLLKKTTYGSKTYKHYLKEMKVALDHHYENNMHHPEYFKKKGIKGMDLLNLMEMLCDWKAATLRHADGDIMKSLEINQKRFGYSNELKQIFKNTIELLHMFDENWKEDENVL